MKTTTCRRCRTAPPSSQQTIGQILDQARHARPALRCFILEIIVEHTLCALFGLCHPCGVGAARAALPPSELLKGGEA